MIQERAQVHQTSPPPTNNVNVNYHNQYKKKKKKIKINIEIIPMHGTLSFKEILSHKQGGPRNGQPMWTKFAQIYWYHEI